MSGIFLSEFNLNAQCLAPTIYASALRANNATPTSISINWVRGNGNGIILLMNESTNVDAFPVNATSYTADANFGNAPQIGSGNRVVYVGTGTSVIVTGLLSNISYFFTAIEFNNTNGYCYQTSGFPSAFWYCRPRSNDGGKIEQVSIKNTATGIFLLNNSNNSVSDGNYQNFNALPIPVLSVGETYTFTIVREGSGLRRCNVVIDYNNDAAFTLEPTTLTGETIYNLAQNPDLITFDYTIPTGVLSGVLAIRFRSFAQNTAISICLNANVAGETEDYQFSVLSELCPFSAFASINTVCPGDSAIITASGADSYLWSTAPELTTLSDSSFSVSPVATATYIVTGVTGNCSETNSVTIEVQPAIPSAGFTYTTIGTDVSFQNASTGASSYLWDFGNGNTSTEMNPSFTFGAGQNFPVKLVAFNTCGNDTIVVNVELIITSLSQTINGEIMIFPNPFQSNLQLTVNRNISESLTLTIYNSIGEVAFSREIKGEKMLIAHFDLSSLSPGIYSLKLADSKGIYWRKIIRSSLN